jgi:RyR domain
MSYLPKPPDLSRITDRPDLANAIEALSERIHDAWAAEKLAQGWRYGPETIVDQKVHASLVPYADLPESEKDFDRTTARTATVGLLDLGLIAEPR